jgi:hypothetical protein
MVQFSIDPPDVFQYWHYEATLGAALLINRNTGAKYRVYKVPFPSSRFYRMWCAVRIR